MSGSDSHQFRDRLASLPEEIYLIPIGFKGYFRKFAEAVTGDKIFNSWLKDAEEDVYTRLIRGLISPLILQGAERK